MKKVFQLLIITIFLFALRSFEGSDTNYFMTDKEIANEYLEKIIEAVQNQDRDALKSMFSNNVLKEVQNMDESIDELFDFYQGYMVSVADSVGPSVKGENHRGIVKKVIQIYRTVETSEKKYHIAIRAVVQDTKFPDNVGLDALYIVETDKLDEPVYDLWMQDGEWLPGITIQKR